MSFDPNRQAQEFEQVKEEFSRLNSQFDALLKAQGVGQEFLQDADPGNPHAEIAEWLVTAKAAAKRAGEERAGRARASSTTGATPSRRPGILRG